MLIGGAGADTLVGGAGDDLIIGGSTAYDNIVPALMAIFAEWKSPNSYATRLQHLRQGGGLNGSNTLVLGISVFEISAADTLTGKGGTDWFFAGASDHITDRQPSEVVN